MDDSVAPGKPESAASWSVYRRCARYWRRSRRLKKAAPTWFPIGSTSTIPHAPACLAPRYRPYSLLMCTAIADMGTERDETKL